MNELQAPWLVVLKETARALRSTLAIHSQVLQLSNRLNKGTGRKLFLFVVLLIPQVELYLDIPLHVLRQF